MARVLLTHIGKPRRANNADGASALGAEYATTTYALENHHFTTPMMGFGLAEITRPDRMVMLGTTGSAWSSTVGVSLSLGDCPEQESDTALELMAELEALEQQDAVTSTRLAELSECLTRWLNVPVICHLTPYVENAPRRDTAHYLKALDNVIDTGDALMIDVTHGLRYHPMLALLAAQYFASMRHTSLEAIYYGAFDRQQEGVTPVLQLDGMLEVLQWVQALNSFDKDGDYSVFRDVLEQDQVPSAICATMEQAAFFERVTNASQAREKLTPLRQYTFDAQTQPLAELFSPALAARTEWAGVSGRGNVEMRLAGQYLQRGDYLRAAIYAQEGYISKRLDRVSANPDDFEQRKEVLDARDHPRDFMELKKLRNTLVHGLRNPEPTLLRLMQNENALRTTLKNMLNQLKNG